MRGQHYTDEQKEQILQEVKEVGNVSLVGRKHGISTSTIFTWISKSKNRDQIKTKQGRKTSIEEKSNEDKIKIANKYINLGYYISLVLRIVKLSRSTYYYNLNYKVKVKAVGRKPVGHSLTKNNKKIYDDEIKEYIMEPINGDAQYYGYRKITYHLRHTYNLIINCKKVYRLCKELNILRCQRKIHFKAKRILASNMTVTASNQVWEIDIKYGYVYGEDKFFYTLNVIDVFDRSIIDYHMGLHCEAKEPQPL